MAEPRSDTRSLAGKGRRVAGTFLLMLGAGIVLESTFQWIGGAIMLAGAAALVRGFLDARPRAAAAAHPPVAHVAHVAQVAQVAQVAIDPQLEGRL